MKTFDLVTEADARTLPAGEPIAIAPGGHVTPLAADTLRARRIPVVRADVMEIDETSLVPKSDIRSVAIGSDHTGIALRRELQAFLRGRGLAVYDLGIEPDTAGSGPVDYPDVAARVALAVARGEADAGIVIDGAGIGSAIAANKIPGIRAAMCPTETIARYSREHNGANVLALGATLLGPEEARAIVSTWLAASMREPRYIRRMAKIRDLERTWHRP